MTNDAADRRQHTDFTEMQQVATLKRIFGLKSISTWNYYSLPDYSFTSLSTFKISIVIKDFSSVSDVEMYLISS